MADRGCYQGYGGLYCEQVGAAQWCGSIPSACHPAGSLREPLALVFGSASTGKAGVVHAHKGMKLPTGQHQAGVGRNELQLGPSHAIPEVDQDS